MTYPLDGKVALITGAGRGIGRGIALRLARDGADVALVDVLPDGINAVADEVAEIGSKATTFVADVRNRQQVFAAVEHAAMALGGLDIVVNNAGIALVGPIADVQPEDVARIWSINVDGVLWGIQAAAAKFKELGPARQDHQRLVHRRPRRLRDARCVQRKQVRGAWSDTGSGQGVRGRRHHGERVLPWHRRNRHVGGDRQTFRRAHWRRRR